MNNSEIEYLAYLLEEARKGNKEKAIVFLGAGVSKTAGIPLADEIIKDVIEKHGHNPKIQTCIKNDCTDYKTIMGTLSSDQRRDLFHSYVTDEKVKLNLANVYLAQLLKVGYVDYIVTVNFDDLILKACTLFNFLPPVYDMSNVKNITTTDKRTGSVIYLHGQYFGEWLLNEEDELKKIEEEVYRLFDNIKTRRTWIIIGYSGRDGIFEKIKSLGSFSNKLFWVKKKLDAKEDTHVIEFLKTPNVNANTIEGYYADGFFLKLHAELSKLNRALEAPDIFYKPFSYLKSLMQNVNAIEGDDELKQQIQQLVETSNTRINKAITQFENENSLEELQQRIIDASLKEDFNEADAKAFEQEILDNNFKEANKHLSLYYNGWALQIHEKAEANKDETLYKLSFKYYKNAIKLNPTSMAYGSYGLALIGLAELISDGDLYRESFEQYKQAIVLAPKDSFIYYNYGNALSDFAKLTSDGDLYRESFEQYKQAIALAPKDISIYNNYGIALSDLAELNSDESLYKDAFKQYKKAIELAPKDSSIYHNYGIALKSLGQLDSDGDLYRESFEQYKQAIELAPEDSSIYHNYGIALQSLAELDSDGDLYIESFKQYKQAIELAPEDSSIYHNYTSALLDYSRLLKGDKKFKTLNKAKEKAEQGYDLDGDPYNLACAYALLEDKDNALNYLKETLDNKGVSKQFVVEDKDWEAYLEDSDFKALLADY